MASLTADIKDAKNIPVIERLRNESPDFNCVSGGYTQVFNGIEEEMKKSLGNFMMDICDLPKKSIKITDQYNEPDIFETSPYTFTPPQALIEYYVAKYLHGRLDKERWGPFSRKSINGAVHDVRLVEKELSQTGEKTPERKQKFRTITIDLFAELWLSPLFNSNFVQNRKVEFPVITFGELVTKIKARMEASGVTPESYSVALIVLPTTNDGEGTDLDELAKRLGIPRKKLFICSKVINIAKLFEELIEVIWSLRALFEPGKENIKR